MEHHNKLYLTSNEEVLFDSNYRYQIAPLEIASVVKKGTRITQLLNFDKFVKDLQFPAPEFLLRFVGKKLSCKSGVDKHNMHYLQGMYSASQVKDVVYAFIITYLLCERCDKPEVAICSSKSNRDAVKKTCRACGHCQYQSSDADVTELVKKYANRM